MYHVHFRGTHYEAGFQWGSRLFRHQNIILAHIPFPVTPERMAYAASCLPVYETYYPEILEEIQGLADGQRCDSRLFRAVLFSMYAMPPSCHCSCFAAVTKNDILLGRNSDFLPDLEKLNLNVIYRLTDGAFSFTGNTTAFVEVEDGINEWGLAIGLTSVFPRKKAPGLNAGLLLRFLLEKCRTVPEAVCRLKELPIASAQTFTMADALGNIGVAECSPEGLEFAETCRTGRKAVYATNTFHLPGMKQYNGPEADNWFAEERYHTLDAAFHHEKPEPGLSFAKELLAGKHGFLCQYDRRTGKDTVWSVIYDVGRRCIYRSEGNPERVRFRQDTRFSFKEQNRK